MIKRLLFRICYGLGFYPTKIKSPEQTFSYLETKPRQIIEEELRKITYAVSLSNDRNYYTDLLKLYVPNWEEKNITSAKFIGEGYGESSLDAYRKVNISERLFFEKVYFTTHPDLKKLRWMEEEGVFSMLNEKIRVPEIRKIYKGELLSIVYFDFLELNEKDTIQEEELVEITKILYRLSLDNVKKIDYWKGISEPVDISFFSHHQYHKYRKAARSLLSKEDVNLVDFEKKAQASQSVLTHGDLQKTNVYDSHTVLDWDSFGIYPVGLEAAFLFFRLVFKESKKEDPFRWLTKNYQTVFDDQVENDFSRNFAYFLFVFSCELFADHREIWLKEKLIRKLKSY